MGYRSEVGICLTNAGRQALDSKIHALEAEDEKTQHIRNLLNASSTKLEDQESGAVGWLWDSVKWYVDYDDVSFIENLLKNLEDTEYLFIRIGESVDDTEVHGAFWDNPFSMNFVRGITYD